MKTKTIIIDDHSLFNDGLSLILSNSDQFDVIMQVYDSRQAYHKCSLLRPSLIIIDYNMPNINGLEVVKQINSLNYDWKIVIVSMYADKKEVSLFKELGVHGFINKTTSSVELIKALKAIMNGENVFISNTVGKPEIQKDEFALKNQFTKREFEILQLIKKDYTTEQIASHLDLSYYTVETHRKNINYKAKFSTKQEFYEFLRSF